MEVGVTIVDSSAAGYTYPATWVSPAIDVRALGGDGGTLQIIWIDVSLTFYLWAWSYPIVTASPPWHDWTAEYRAGDPAWVDPVKGDPASEHPVRWKNLGFRYVAIGWSASDWTGGSKYVSILFERDRYVK